MDGLQWAVQTAETFMSASDLQGYHPELAKRCLCAGMMLLSIGRVWEQTGEAKYFDYMKKHMDLFVEPGGASERMCWKSIISIKLIKARCFSRCFVKPGRRGMRRRRICLRPS